jgi:hypothetical protein
MLQGVLSHHIGSFPYHDCRDTPCHRGIPSGSPELTNPNLSP